MKSLACMTVAVALLGLPAVASAQRLTTPAPGPGQSEWSPGHRAKTAGSAKTYAPGQRMHQRDVKGQPGASEYAPGHLPNKDVRR